jgi:hypothetical protein
MQDLYSPRLRIMITPATGLATALLTAEVATRLVKEKFSASGFRKSLILGSGTSHYGRLETIRFLNVPT